MAKTTAPDAALPLRTEFAKIPLMQPTTLGSKNRLERLGEFTAGLDADLI